MTGRQDLVNMLQGMVRQETASEAPGSAGADEDDLERCYFCGSDQVYTSPGPVPGTAAILDVTECNRCMARYDEMGEVLRESILPSSEHVNEGTDDPEPDDDDADA